MDRVDSSWPLDSFPARSLGRWASTDSAGQPLTIAKTAMTMVTSMRETTEVSLLPVALVKLAISAYCFDSYSAHASLAFDVAVTDLVELMTIN